MSSAHYTNLNVSIVYYKIIKKKHYGEHKI
jgi:hypothetical protein